jgi:hypothetical protein
MIMAKTIKTVEIDGFSIDVDTAVFQDYEFLESLADVSDGQPASIVRPFRMLFAGDTYQKVKDHLRDEDGRVPVKAMSTFLAKTVKAAAPNF